MSGWPPEYVFYKMNVIEIQTSMIHASRQKMREMQHMTTSVAGALGLMFQKKGSSEPTILDRLNKDIDRLGSYLVGYEPVEFAKKDKAKLGRQLISGFSKLMGKPPIMVQKGQDHSEAWQESPAVTKSTHTLTVREGPPPGGMF